MPAEQHRQLSAPTTGTYAGIIFYQDRTIVSGDKNSIPRSGTSFEGTLYSLPRTGLLRGSGGSAVYDSRCEEDQFLRSSTLNSDYSTLTRFSIKEGVVFG